MKSFNTTLHGVLAEQYVWRVKLGTHKKVEQELSIVASSIFEAMDTALAFTNAEHEERVIAWIAQGGDPDEVTAANYADVVHVQVEGTVICKPREGNVDGAARSINAPSVETSQ